MMDDAEEEMRKYSHGRFSSYVTSETSKELSTAFYLKDRLENLRKYAQALADRTLFYIARDELPENKRKEIYDETTSLKYQGTFTPRSLTTRRFAEALDYVVDGLSHSDVQLDKNKINDFRRKLYDIRGKLGVDTSFGRIDRATNDEMVGLINEFNDLYQSTLKPSFVKFYGETFRKAAEENKAFLERQQGAKYDAEQKELLTRQQEQDQKKSLTEKIKKFKFVILLGMVFTFFLPIFLIQTQTTGYTPMIGSLPTIISTMGFLVVISIIYLIFK